MDFSKITIFDAMKRRLGWLAQRQEILAQNVANADTPERKAYDIEPFSFRRLLKRDSMRVTLAATDRRHLEGNPALARDFTQETERRPYETAPAGNAVVLEEQMMKLNKTAADHKLMTELYKKHLDMFRTAVSGG